MSIAFAHFTMICTDRGHTYMTSTKKYPFYKITIRKSEAALTPQVYNSFYICLYVHRRSYYFIYTQRYLMSGRHWRYQYSTSGKHQYVSKTPVQENLIFKSYRMKWHRKIPKEKLTIKSILKKITSKSACTQVRMEPLHL